MRKLLTEGFGIPQINIQQLPYKQALALCSDDSTLNWESLMAHNIVCIQEEKHAGHAFNPLLRTGCPELIRFVTVIRDPVNFAIRERWDFQQSRINDFTSPSTCSHMKSLLGLGGLISKEDSHVTECQWNQNDVENAKTVLKRFSAVCITERYEECPLILAVGMKVKMSRDDVNALAERYLRTNAYPSQKAGKSGGYVTSVMNNGSPREQDFVRKAQELLAPESQLYEFAKVHSDGQLKFAKNYLQMSLESPTHDTELFETSLNMTHVIQHANEPVDEIV